MKHFLSLMFLALAAAVPAAFAQKWEVGIGAGGSFLTSHTISNPVGNADASRDPGLALSAWLDNNIGSGVFGGELRYDHEIWRSEALLGRHHRQVRKPEQRHSL